MIYSFTPKAGRQIGHTYFFPPVTSDSRDSKRQLTLKQIALSDGEVDDVGTAAMPLLSTDFTLAFTMTPDSWYKVGTNGLNNRDYYNGTTSDTVARENALIDFTQCVVEGGQGTMTDFYGTGLIDWVTGQAFTGYSAEVKVSGDVTVTRAYGKVTIEIAISNPSALWNLVNGSTVIAQMVCV